MQQHRPQPSSKIFYKKAELQIRSSAFFMLLSNDIERLFRISQTFWPDIVKNIFQIFVSKIFCHTEIHIQIIAAVLCGSTRNLTFKISDEFKHLSHERNDIFGFIIACQQKIVSCAAAHRTPVNYFWTEFSMIAEKRSCQMFLVLHLGRSCGYRKL